MAIALSAGTTTARSPGTCATCPDLTVVTNSIWVADVLHRAAARPDRPADRRPAHAVRRAGRPGGRGRAPQLHVDLLFLGVHGMDERAGLHHARTCWRPRPTARWSARPAGSWSSPTTPSGASSGSPRIAALRRGRRAGHRRRAAGRRARQRSREQVGELRRRAARQPERRGGRDARTARGWRTAARSSTSTRPTTPTATARRHARAAASADRLGDPLRRRARRVGGDRLAPPGPHPPAAERRVPAVPVDARRARPRSRRRL